MITKHAGVEQPYYPSELQGRQSTWELLCREGVPQLWLPRMCDAAMSHCPNATSMNQICECSRFIEGCNGLAFRQPGLEITPSSALGALANPARPLFKLYLELQSRRLQRFVPFGSEQERLDAIELLDESAGELSRRFRAGTVTPAGLPITWGWEAFLALRIIGKTAEKFRSLRRQIALAPSSSAFQGLPCDKQFDPDQDGGELKGALLDILPRLLKTEFLRSAFRDLVYEGKSYGEVASRHGCSISRVGYQVWNPLLAALRKAAGRGGSQPIVSFRSIREPLAQLVPVEVFDTLVNPRAEKNQIQPKNSSEFRDCGLNKSMNGRARQQPKASERAAGLLVEAGRASAGSEL